MTEQQLRSYIRQKLQESYKLEEVEVLDENIVRDFLIGISVLGLLFWADSTKHGDYISIQANDGNTYSGWLADKTDSSVSIYPADWQNNGVKIDYEHPKTYYAKDLKSVYYDPKNDPQAIMAKIGASNSSGGGHRPGGHY